MAEPEGEYLKGFWLSDPDQKLDSEFTPIAILFFEEGLLARLDFVEDEDGNLFTEFTIYGYVLADDEIWVGRTNDPEYRTRGGLWELTPDGKLRLELSGTWVSFVPTDTESLVEAGVRRGTIENLIKTAKEQGLEFVERYDPGKT